MKANEKLKNHSNFGKAPYFPVPDYNRFYYEEVIRRPGSLYSY